MSYARSPEELREQFRSPDRRRFGLSPCWRWNAWPERESLLEQLRRFAERGCCGVVAEVDETPSEYTLTADWRDDICAALGEAQRLQMGVWLSFSLGRLYDAFCQHDGARAETHQAQDLACHHWRTQRGRWRKVRFADEVLTAWAAPAAPRGQHLPLDTAIDITESVRNVLTPRQVGPGVEYEVFVFTVGRRQGLDLLSGYAAPLLVDEVLSPLWSAMSREQRSALRGMRLRDFALSEPAAPGLALRVPWTYALPMQFGARAGGDLMSALPAVCADTGVAAGKVRQDFWRTVHSLVVDEFLSPLCEWLADRGMRLDIEPRPADSLAESLYYCPELSLLQSMNHPVTLTTPMDQDSTGLLKAVARGGGMVTRLSPLRSERALTPAVILAALASRSQFPVEVVSPFSVDYAWTAESPTHLAWQWDDRQWECADELSCQVARLQTVLGAGSHAAQVALLHPLRSVAAHFGETGENSVSAAVERDWQTTRRFLQDHDFAYHVITESQLCDSRVVDGKLILEDQAYEILVLPSTPAISPAAWSRLQQFVEAGGRVACLGLLPWESARGVDSQLESTVRQDTLVDVEQIAKWFAGEVDDEENPVEVYPIARERESGGRLCCYQPALVEDREDARLRTHQIFIESIDASIEGVPPDVITCHRRIGSTDIVLFVNTSAERLRTTPRLRRTGAVDRWDLSHGDVSPLWTYALIEKAQTSVPLSLCSDQVAVLSWRDEERIHADAASLIVEECRAADGCVEVVGLAQGERGFVTVDVDGEVWTHESTVEEGAPLVRELDGEWSVEWREDNRLYFIDWHPATQSGWRRWRGRLSAAEQDHSGGGRDGWLETVFHCPSRPTRAVLEQLSSEKTVVRLNGTALRFIAVDENPRRRACDVTRRLRRRNVLQVRTGVDGPPTRAWLSRCLRMRGDFVVSKTDHGPVLQRGLPDRLMPNSWTEQGMAWYSGIVECHARVSLSSSWESRRVWLEIEASAAAVEAQFNGHDLGRRLTPPLHFEIPPGVVRADNDIRIRLAGAPTEPTASRRLPSGLLAPPRLRGLRPVDLRVTAPAESEPGDMVTDIS